MIDIQYLELLEKILTQGHKKGGRNGGTHSIFSAQIEHDMKDGFPLLTTKKMAWHQIRTEFLWMVRGSTNIQWLLENGNEIWVGDAYKQYLEWETGAPLPRKEFIEKIKMDFDFASNYGGLGPIYGEQYRCRPWVDQLQRSLDLLRNEPNSRKNVVSAWIPEDLHSMALEPCHFAFKFYTRELDKSERLTKYRESTPSISITEHPYIEEEMDLNGVPQYALSLKFYMRSCDSSLGLPFNIAFYALMLEVYARMANMVPEKLIGDLSDVHIYDNQIEGVHTQLDRNPIECQPKLLFPEHVEFGKGIDDFVDSVKPEDFQIEGYESHGRIKFPLSN